MNVPHFYKFRLRIGMPHPPIHHTEMNIGVEEGPDAVLSEVFLNSFPESAVHVFDYTLPEKSSALEYEHELAKAAIACRGIISATLKPNEVQVSVGGDHSMTFFTLQDILSRKKDVSALGYIQFDSHGDMNLRKDSLTDNFHGMYLRSFLDATFDMPEIRTLTPYLLPVENVLFVGNLDLDTTGEQQYFEAQRIEHISKDDVRNNFVASMERFEAFIRRFQHLHVTFDIDALDQSIAPATGIPAVDGLLWKDIRDMLCAVAKHPSFSFDLAEVNPRKPGAQQTICMAQKILKTILRVED